MRFSYLLLILTYCCYGQDASAEDLWGECFPAASSATQSVVIDNVQPQIFAYNLQGDKDKQQNAVISTLPASGGNMHWQTKTAPLALLGHQGLALQYHSRQRYSLVNLRGLVFPFRIQCYRALRLPVFCPP